MKQYTITWELYEWVEAETEDEVYNCFVEALRSGDIYPTRTEVAIEEQKSETKF